MSENFKHSLESRSQSPKRPSKISKTTNEEEEEESESMSKPQGIQRYLIAIEYIGTRFSGSQQQSNCRTVVGVLEEAFRKFIGQPVSIFCSSRTDAGVHALSNVCHVDIERISKRKPGEVLPPHEPIVVQRAVNHFLQKNEGDVMVVDVQSVPADFHARFKAQERTYFYRLLSGPEPLSTFEKDRAWHIPEELDVLAMQEACKILVGHHDFSSFRAAGCQAKSPIRTLDELNVSEVISSPNFPTIAERTKNLVQKDIQCTNNPEADCHSSFNGGTDQGFGLRKKHRCFVVTARARAFLYHQVLNLSFRCLVYYVYVLWVSGIKAFVDGESIRALLSVSELVSSFVPVLRLLKLYRSASIRLYQHTQELTYNSIHWCHE